MKTAALYSAFTFASAALLTAQPSAFTYQGRLAVNGAFTNGLYDLQFTLHDAATGGNLVAGPLTNAATAISSGLFTVPLDFGAAAFNGNARWLGIGVRTNGSGSFAILTTRQPFTAVPYAITAGAASSLAGTLPATQLSGTVPISQLPAGVALLSSNLTFTGTVAFTNKVGIGAFNPQASLQVIGTFIAGGAANTIAPGVTGSTIAGGGVFGFPNSISSESSFIGAGATNVIGAGSASAFIGAGNKNTIQTNAAYSVIGGGQDNSVGGLGFLNSSGAVIGGGLGNVVNGLQSTISGGYVNSSSGAYEFIGGGAGNTNLASYAAIVGGALNVVSGNYGAVGGGYGNNASGWESTVPGGTSNTAAGYYSFAAGKGARALHDGTFVWVDSQPGSVSSTANDQFLIRAGGGVGIGTANPACPLHVGALNASGESLVLGVDPHVGGYTALVMGLSSTSGGYAWLQGIKASGSTYGDVVLNPSSGNVGIGTAIPSAKLEVNGEAKATVFTATSDRDAKENSAPVDGRSTLDKVLSLPIMEWSFKQLPGARHLGPTAQDFHDAFNLGADDKHIATVDADGVALAAIQGLNQKVEELKAELKSRDERNAELQRRLEALEQKLTGGR